MKDFSAPFAIAHFGRNDIKGACRATVERTGTTPMSSRAFFALPRDLSVERTKLYTNVIPSAFALPRDLSVERTKLYTICHPERFLPSRGIYLSKGQALHQCHSERFCPPEGSIGRKDRHYTNVIPSVVEGSSIPLSELFIPLNDKARRNPSGIKYILVLSKCELLGIMMY